MRRIGLFAAVVCGVLLLTSCTDTTQLEEEIAGLKAELSSLQLQRAASADEEAAAETEAAANAEQVARQLTAINARLRMIQADIDAQEARIARLEGPPDVPPVASFTVPSDAQRGVPVQFESLATDEEDDDSSLLHLWQFGDGVVTADRNPTHTYEAAGVYNVELVVTDSAGNAHAHVEQLEVREPDE